MDTEKPTCVPVHAAGRTLALSHNGTIVSFESRYILGA